MRSTFWRYVFVAGSMALLTGCTIDPAVQTEGTSGLASVADQPLAERPASLTTAPTVAPACSSEIIQQLLTPAAVDPTPVALACSAILPPDSTVSRQIVFEGSSASGSGLDCNGGLLEGTDLKRDREAVVIRSRKVGDTWSTPVGVTVRNCRIINGLRIYGLGRNADEQAVRLSSMNRNHTALAQAAAPSGIVLDHLRFTNSNWIPLYIGPGVTNVTLSNSQFTGTSTSTAIYLDAESGATTIVNNSFDLRSNPRELIAIDGSAYNIITGNRFNRASKGGIFAYRNCGEAGTIRHQAPQFNRIEKNIFDMNGSSKPAVWLNSRNGNRSYCFKDPSHPFGSSVTWLDLAKHNIVEDNKVVDGGRNAFRNDDPTNRLSRNGED